MHRSLIRNRAVVVAAAVTAVALLAVAPAARAAIVPTWTPVPPVTHLGTNAILDPVRGRWLFFRLSNQSNSPVEIWAFDLATATWSMQAPPGDAPAMAGSIHVVYDPLGDRALVFHPFFNLAAGDIWQLPLSMHAPWVRVSTSWQGGNRSGECFAVDTRRNRALMFGGRIGVSGSTYSSDVFSIDLGDPNLAMTLLAVAPSPVPVGRSNCAAVYDSTNDRFVIYGGESYVTGGPGTGQRIDESWELALAGTPTWRFLPPVAQPAAREYMASAFDPLHHRLLIYGGDGAGGVRGDGSALDLTDLTGAHWTPLPAGGGAARQDLAGAYDVAHDRFLVQGGNAAQGQPPAVLDVWAQPRALAGWTDLTPAIAAPMYQPYFSTVYDTHANRLLAIGVSQASGVASEVWSLKSQRWTQVIGGLARGNASAVWDPVRQRVLLFGGLEGTWRNDVLALDLSGTPTWFTLATSGTPPSPRGWSSAIYDPNGDRMIVFGGAINGGARAQTNEIWSLGLGSIPAVWSQITPAGTAPRSQQLAQLALDVARDRLYLGGGTDSTSYAWPLWQLDLGASPAWGPAPSTGLIAGWSALACDARSDRLVAVFGSNCGDPGLPCQSRVYTLPLAEPANWQLTHVDGLAPPNSGLGAVTYDPGSGALWMAVNINLPLDVWRLDLGAVALAVEPPPAAASAVRVSPNPGHGRFGVSFSLASATPVTLDIVDIAGRRIAHERRTLGPGEQRLEPDPGRALAPGVYLVRLTAGALRYDGRAIVVR